MDCGRFDFLKRPHLASAPPIILSTRACKSREASFLRARTDYANRACNVTCNVMLVAKLVPRTADEPSAQRTASILRSLIDRTPFHRHRGECLCCKKSNSAHNICLSLIHTRRINNSTSFRFTAVILLTTS
jgi:hypothetical protein